MKILLALIVLLFPVSALAADCYGPAEMEAEQGIRIHSELMVIGLNCQHMTPAGQKNFYAQYRQFTAMHESLFSNYENRLISHFRKNGSSNPESALNDLRTGFANKISNDAAQMRPDIFCARYVDRLTRAATMDRASLKTWAATPFPSHPVSRPMCR